MKTVRQLLTRTHWENLIVIDKKFKNFMDSVGNLTCKFPATIKKDVTYYELHQKHLQGEQFFIFQDGEVFYHNFSAMSPFKDALCLCCKYLPFRKVEIFEYRQTPFADTIFLDNVLFLLCQFEDYTIFKMDGSQVKSPSELTIHEEFFAISKKTLSYEGPFQDGSEENNCHVVVRYIPPEWKYNWKK